MNKASGDSRQNALYREACASFGPALRRLVRGYEADSDIQRDLLQDIHLELWKSLGNFDGGCSLRTWTYRVAHNVAATHVMRARRAASALVDLERVEAGGLPLSRGPEIDRRVSVATLLDLIRRLRPLDRQVIMLYLEGETAGEIAAVTGMAAGAVATRVHRIKRMLRQQYEGDADVAR